MADPAPAPRGAAFFDVDGTLTRGTTLFRFLEYRFASEGRAAHTYRHERQRLRAMTAGGLPRTETSRAYFASYEGLDASYVAQLAAEWFRGELAHGKFLHEPTVSALREHQAAGEPVVLVSGSFPAALAPLARHLRVDAVLATEPEIVGDLYSGRVHTPMIGSAKAEAARSWARARGVDLTASTAYGDHSSDLPLLELSGHAVLVGGEPELRERARWEGWRQLPPPRPAPALRLPAALTPPDPGPGPSPGPPPDPCTPSNAAGGLPA
ncbi:HAD family hydrolase [Streptomyces iconiensis]|uniref:HAD-IB family hydrolase n=1 Tax=Streptomyces iconiensis TaxID=1384038 RepID=A0ABT6ZSJ1_9ACTN|nr:HAD-IB family hydrolase [Streptomyces iconiensis]MDJ1132030.1 HAD-IB family hydrolase [Streptomyces iconiensis]